MTEQTTIDPMLPELLRKCGITLMEAGIPPQEVVSGLMGAAIDLARSLIGPELTRTYLADVAIRLDEELTFGG